MRSEVVNTVAERLLAIQLVRMEDALKILSEFGNWEYTNAGYIFKPVDGTKGPIDPGEIARKAMGCQLEKGIGVDL